ncbi:hypothetical protein ACFVFQ_28435 [Streptomyces sp. NPDC057743]|uniref:hypothetical protein n=1 Tax=Streptomyces sp. NPDC057743 TaxID=3346236 RepID=UPI00367CC66F
MKQGTIKTLGAVALGAAIAASAAGVASAAPGGDSLNANGVLRSLPVKDATKTLSGATQNEDDGNGVKPKTKVTSKGNKLLGGLPTSKITKGIHLGR